MTRHSCLYALTDEASLKSKLEQIRAHYRSNGIDIEITAEVCYHLVLSMDEQKFLRDNWSKLQILLSHSPFDINLSTKSNFISNNVVEIGPRASMKTACCTNMLNVFRSALIEGVVRIERSTRYFINPFVPHDFFSAFGDRMTECVYSDGMCFEKLCKRADFFEIDLLSDRTNLEKQNRELGLALDQEDLKYYYEIFANNIGRNPTDVELFDLAQSDSEHSRHWFFRGEISVDGERRLQSLMSSIRGTLETSNKNSLIAFRDNSSAIRGFDGICCLRPKDGTETSKFELSRKPVHLIYSAETHNFPTAVCPFQGATTGTGGRIRDIHATGKGAFEIAGVAGYSFGNLRIPGFEMPWETAEERHPFTLSTPLQVAIEASNGASDYGNKFGEPVICGFSRSFGQRLPSGERCEYLKPIMFSGGMGSIDEDQLEKEKCAPGQFLAKIGGPVYRIGVGGGAASSLAVQGDRENDLDFAAVQRGDAEMGGKLHRVVRSCAEMGLKNPLESIHDQGAGGNGNVIKEIVDGCGVHVSGSSFEFGDESASARELWTAEYQESDACLVNPNRLDVLLKVGRREKCTVSVVGVVDEGRKVILDDIETDSNRIPVNLPMDLLSERPMKEFALETVPQNLESFRLPPSLTVREALSRVLRLPSVACKRYLTCKVDRSVTGLVARQQCVGCLQTPLADVAVVALSHFQTVGSAVAVGEQPVKMLVDPACGARMTLAETLTNLVFAPISAIEDVKMSGNWMFAAKCAGEGARLVRAVDALCQGLIEVGCAIDGGKDSLSMATKVDGELVKAPGTLVLSAYAPCTDVTKVLTPTLQAEYESEKSTTLLYIRMGSDPSHHRLGGSSLAQVFSQIGDTSPDIESFAELKSAFKVIQRLITENKILSGHDVSDGGLITTIAEMAFAGNCTVRICVHSEYDPISVLFAEECGIVIEVANSQVGIVCKIFESESVAASPIGFATAEFGVDAKVNVMFNDKVLIEESLNDLREEWEELGDKLGVYQTTAKCLEEARTVRKNMGRMHYKCNFDFSYDVGFLNVAEYFTTAPKVAIIREEGSNGDREMAAAFALAGFEPFDVTMTDLLAGLHLNSFRGAAFVGGFSYADVLGSAKGWAASILFSDEVRNKFELFRRRSDTFSLGVCNGCQLMAHIGWIAGAEDGRSAVFLDENECGRFESSFSVVRVDPNPSLMLRGMHGSVLGVWSSHGEGRFTYRTPDVLESLKRQGLVCLRYANEDGASAVDGRLPYPLNPNGSEFDVAAICSNDGRHLAMMPHPDRSFLSWQWPEYPNHWKEPSESLPTAPWVKIFRNAYDWCTDINQI